MTFVICAGNRDQLIQISDRRLSSRATIMDEESNKLTSIECLDARFVLGYTGVARVGKFVFQKWLLETLLDIGKTTGEILEVFEQLTLRLTQEFKSNWALKALGRNHNRLTIMGTGFVDHTPPRLGCCLISNFQDFETGVDAAESWPEFKGHYTLEKETAGEEMSVIQRVGAWPAMSLDDEKLIRDLLVSRKSAIQIKKTLASVVREIADRREAGNTVGKQLNIVTIPREPGAQALVEYDGLLPCDSMHLGDKVTLRGALGFSAIMSDLTIAVAEPDPDRPAFVRKTGRNKLCPCESGRKYKHCHGKKNP